MINHIIDHALSTIGCTLDGMEAVIEMMTEVESVSTDAIGYLLINCIASIREQCDAIEMTSLKSSKQEEDPNADN